MGGRVLAAGREGAQALLAEPGAGGEGGGERGTLESSARSPEASLGVCPSSGACPLTIPPSRFPWPSPAPRRAPAHLGLLVGRAVDADRQGVPAGRRAGRVARRRHVLRRARGGGGGGAGSGCGGCGSQGRVYVGSGLHVTSREGAARVAPPCLRACAWRTVGPVSKHRHIRRCQALLGNGSCTRSPPPGESAHAP